MQSERLETSVNPSLVLTSITGLAQLHSRHDALPCDPFVFIMPFPVRSCKWKTKMLHTFLVSSIQHIWSIIRSSIKTPWEYIVILSDMDKINRYWNKRKRHVAVCCMYVDKTSEFPRRCSLRMCIWQSMRKLKMAANLQQHILCALCFTFACITWEHLQFDLNILNWRLFSEGTISNYSGQRKTVIPGKSCRCF